MDTNDLLAATREEFLKAFAESLAGLLTRSADRLFLDAEQSRNMAESRLCLDARSILTTQSDEISQQIRAAMERLLNRGFKTAYSSFRPSFSKAFKVDKLSLIDAKAFEGELLIDELTTRFRNASETELRDLNIRIAVLFDQDNISERENPFRPFMFTRSISSALEQLDITKELTHALTTRLAEDAIDIVVSIYQRLNALLADHGVAATLQLKPTQAMEEEEWADPLEDAAEPEPIAAAGRGQGSNAPSRGGRHMAPVGRGMSHFSPTLRHENRIEQLFERVQNQLAEQVTLNEGLDDAAHEGLMAGQQAPALMPARGSNSGGGAKPKKGWLSEVKNVGKAIRGFFSSSEDLEHDEFGPNEDFEHAVAGSRQASDRLVQSVDKLLRTQTPDVGELVTADNHIRNLILEARPALNAMDLELSEQMTIDIVAMLFEFILKDPHVPAEIRAQLGRLQFLVLKLALKDPTLFTQAHHPARLLVNRIGSVSFALKKVDPSGERITQEICRIIEVLLADQNESLALFTTMLDEFDTFIARELRAGEKPVEHAIEVVEDAEARTLRYARIMALMSESLDGLTLDASLRDFLIITWSRVLERAYHSNDPNADMYRDVIGEVIWSIAPKVHKKERSTLLKMIPRLLETLQMGLKLSSWQPAQKQELLNWLINAHSLALRVSNVPMPVPSIEDLQALFAQIPGNAESAPAPAQPSPQQATFNSQYFHELIQEIEDSLASASELLSEVEAKEPQEMVSSTMAQEKSTIDPQVLESLRCGISIEVRLGNEPSQAKLNWVSASGSNLAMTIDGRHKPIVVSVKMFQRLLNQGRARFLESSQLFERAVEHLLETADQMDMA